MPIDYELEYDNRARVPEHPEIFARWTREAEAYRQVTPKAELGLSYGPSPRQTIDLFPADGAALALFVHGGWWRSLEPAMFSQMAKGPNTHGISVAMVGYDICPQVSITAIIEQVRAACLSLWRYHHKYITLYGHSAGGHLVACMLATDFSTLAADAPADLVPAAYAISGVYDLAPLLQITPNAEIRLDKKSAQTRSPLTWPPPVGRKFDAVVGALQSGEFLRQSKLIAEIWGERGVITRHEEIVATNHFTVIDLLTDPDSARTRRVVELAHGVHAMAL